jgi:hypothetical protein
MDVGVWVWQIGGGLLGQPHPKTLNKSNPQLKEEFMIARIIMIMVCQGVLTPVWHQALPLTMTSYIANK